MIAPSTSPSDPSPHARSLLRATVHGLVWTISGKGAGAILQVVVLAALARLLDPADFGVVTAALIVILFFSMVARLGLGHALVQRHEIDHGHISTAYWTALLLGVALSGTVWVSAPLFAGLLRIDGAETTLRALAGLFPLRALISIADSLLQRRARFRLMAKIDVASYAFGFGVCGVGAAWAGAGVWALVAAHYAAALTALGLLAVFHARFRLVAPDRGILRDLLAYGGGVTIGKFINHIALEVDNIVVARLSGAAMLGLYGRAYQLMAMPGNLLGEALDRVLFPTMSRVQGEPERLRRIFLRGLSAVTLLALPGSMLAMVLAPELIDLVLGPRWGAVTGPFQVLALGFFFRTGYRISDSLAYATGAVYRRAWRQAVYAVCVAAGAWIGHGWGLTGVAAGVLAALGVNYLLMAQLSLSILGIGWSRLARAQLPGLLLGTVAGLAAWGSASGLRAVDFPLIPTIIVVTGAGADPALLFFCLFPDTLLGGDAQWARDLAHEKIAGIRARRRAAAPVWRPPAAERLTMVREGVTEQLVTLSVPLPATLGALDRSTRAQVWRYLPGKNGDPARASAMGRTVAHVAWDQVGLGGRDIRSMVDFEPVYRQASVAGGRSHDQTDDRIADIGRYVRALERGAAFPPILLHFDGEALVQLDGARRMLAHLIAGRATIDAVVVVQSPIVEYATHP
jgi:O-antigen/teichoic acid export membrane protein